MKEFFEKFNKKWYSPVFFGFLLAGYVGGAMAILFFYILNNDDL